MQVIMDQIINLYIKIYVISKSAPICVLIFIPFAETALGHRTPRWHHRFGAQLQHAPV